MGGKSPVIGSRPWGRSECSLQHVLQLAQGRRDTSIAPITRVRPQEPRHCHVQPPQRHRQRRITFALPHPGYGLPSTENWNAAPWPDRRLNATLPKMQTASSGGCGESSNKPLSSGTGTGGVSCNFFNSVPILIRHSSRNHEKRWEHAGSPGVRGEVSYLVMSADDLA